MQEMDDAERKMARNRKRRRLFECDGFLNGLKVTVLFDTGASGDALSEEAARLSGVPLTALDQPRIVGGIGGRELAHHRALDARLFIQQMTFVRNFIVVPCSLKVDVILGAMWFNRFQPVFDWDNHYLSITLEPSLHFIIQADPARFRSVRQLARAADLIARETSPNVSGSMEESQEQNQKITKENDASRACIPESEVACSKEATESRRQHNEEQTNTCLEEDTCLEEGQDDDDDDDEHLPMKTRKKLEKMPNSSTTHGQDESSVQAIEEAKHICRQEGQ